MVHKDIFLFVLLAIGIDGIPFFAGYALLRCPLPLTFWKPTVHLALIITATVPFFFWHGRFTGMHPLLYLILLVFGFTVLNAVLWKMLFKETRWKTWLFSFFMGFINAIFCWCVTPMIKG